MVIERARLQMARRLAAEAKLLEAIPDLAGVVHDDYTRRYFDNHACERPPQLADVCVSLGRDAAGLALPATTGPMPAALARRLAARRQGDPNATFQDVLMEAEKARALELVELAGRIDAWLGIRGCGPHSWQPRIQMSQSESTSVAKGSETAIPVCDEVPERQGCREREENGPGTGASP